ncbi:unnamed protein product [Ostreobium quekettii]|uniref:Uncharacterized protein n=1 Tax=Ostreobium quekettii TaxID=121088 RepID=A0A8S1IVI5_9CHLO|nr:unnamed protein product [Ostreobium quekettii]
MQFEKMVVTRWDEMGILLGTSQCVPLHGLHLPALTSYAQELLAANVSAAHTTQAVLAVFGIETTPGCPVGLFGSTGQGVHNAASQLRASRHKSTDKPVNGCLNDATVRPLPGPGLSWDPLSPGFGTQGLRFM